ncbi:MAG: thioredoxin domain-containing protein [Chlorobium sp.]|uniref:thioredoxin domain-containing protein n=1 Tax=Chlorobium sp. TaxID=1095 RepID=UPI0025BB02A5|nr:thioredoxin domain-containing protein [Chlorobium sp.]MCF8383586.1 thioredoxin domain-containing protein [Chlorobium sp.]
MNRKPAEPNLLAREKSPYLLQHAFNPVDWHPWGPEAFRKSRERNIPIFLSVGYATCHWCHVMERESFENEETARLLNDNFIPVKVDREELPDLDRLYMTYVQASTGRGGWPMSVWLTPDLKPFYGGSYFPPEDRYGMPGFRTVLSSIAQLWKTDPARIRDASRIFFEQLQPPSPIEKNGIPEKGEAQEACFMWLESLFDPIWGGFGSAPKFPRPVLLTFLFSHSFHTGNPKAASMALLTLKKMADGGIHDHVRSMGKGGGGFARYSTDLRWHLPHFEKMLYDNAQLAMSYLEAYQISGDRFFSSVAEDIFNYVLHDMQSPEGGFYSAEDADSFPDGEAPEKREGAFYVWSWKEVMSLPADPEKLELFARTYGMKPEGNVPVDPHGEFGGKNVLMEQSAPEEHEKNTATVLDEVRALLYEKRLHRPRPLLDDKIITSWNGLMISALAKGYRVLGHEEYLMAARNAADFILRHLYEENGNRLLRRYRDGDAAFAGKGEDYAFLTRGLLDLYQACFDDRYLDVADRLCSKCNNLFYDHAGGGYFSTAMDDDSVPVRLKEEYDGAEPAATSVCILNLLDLAVMTGNEEYFGMAEACFRSFGTMLSLSSHALPLMLAALNNARKGGILAILAGRRESPEMQKLLKMLNAPYMPGLAIMHASAGSLNGVEIPEAIDPDAATPVVFLCIGHSCRLPATTPEALDELLKEAIR